MQKSKLQFKIQNFNFLIVVFSFLFLLFNFSEAQAASLYFFPSSGSYAIGATFSAGVYVSSADQAMNAASGIITFPQDKLEVSSLSKTGSIFSLWVQEPSFSNISGTINFEGIALNPGFTGASGKLITVNLKIKSAGTATLSFSSGSVLANDGKGTNILTSLGNAQFNLGEAMQPEAPEIVTPTETAGAPAAPEISSSTHPDSEKWYGLSDAEFNWKLPKGIIALRLLVDKNPASVPTITYDPPINSKKVDGNEDGVWYLHARFKNSAGWGKISHFKFKVDTEPPEPFSIKFIDGEETDNPQPTILFNTADSLSGVDYYKIKIGEGDLFDIGSDIVATNPYVLPLQAPGRRTILIQAFDKAGNSVSASGEFVIKPISAPTITDYSSYIKEGETGFIKGSAYPESTVVAWFERQKSLIFEKPFSRDVKSDKNGNFLLIIDKDFGKGNYNAWLEVVDRRGARSSPTEKFIISIETPAWMKIGISLVTIFAVIIPLVALFFFFAFLVWFLWHKFKLFKKRVKKEIGDVDKTLHKAFDKLRDDVREQIKMLEKVKSWRELTKEEEKIIKQLKKDLDEAEKFVKKEIEDIEKEIKY